MFMRSIGGGRRLSVCPRMWHPRCPDSFRRRWPAAHL